MLRQIILLSPLLPLLLTNTAYSASKPRPKVVCVNPSGDVLIKSKCKKTEKVLSAAFLNQSITTSAAASGPAGSIGPVGISGVTGATGAAGNAGPNGIQGVKGAPGQINFSACRLTAESYTTNFSIPADPILYAEVYCNENTEYLLQDESRVSFFPDAVGSKVALQGRLPFHKSINGDNREYGVGVYANRITQVGSGIYEFIVRGICCPR